MKHFEKINYFLGHELKYENEEKIETNQKGYTNKILERFH